MLLFSSCANGQAAPGDGQDPLDATVASELPVIHAEETTLPQGSSEATGPDAEDASLPSVEATIVPETSEVEETAAPTIPVEATAPAEPLDVTAGTISGRYDSKELGDHLDYLVHIPQNATENMPLVIFLHGDGQVGNINVLRWFFLPAKAREIYGEAFPFFILTPCTRTESWIDGTIPGTLMELIDSVAETYRIDRDRIIISGHSRGAIGVWYLINTYGDLFSAAVPVSCESDVELDGGMCAQVPVWAFVGDADKNEWDLLPLMQEHVDLINSCGGSAYLTVIPDALHTETSSEAYTLETFEWMLAQ